MKMPRRKTGGFLLLAGVVVLLFLLEKPIERLADRLLYAPWAYGDETLTGVWNGRLPDGTPLSLTLLREEEGGIPAPTDSTATVVGSLALSGEVWQVNGRVNRSGSDVELVLWRGSEANIGGFFNGAWSGNELILDAELNGQMMRLRLTKGDGI